jgi:hypothetical protein
MKAKIILPLAIVVTTLNVGAQVVSPVTPTKIKGHTYADWSEEWWQWAYSLPTDHHPLFESADTSAGQKGDVWFLGGSFDESTVTRTAVVPKNKLLFFAIITGAFDNTDCNGAQRISDGLPVSDLRGFVQTFIDTVNNVSFTIDGVPVSGLADAVHSNYRVPSSSPNGFSYNLAGMNNILIFNGLTCWSSANRAPIHVDANVYHPVADGIYVMVGPLAPGSHIISFHAEATGFDGSPFVQDATYNLTVTQ